LNEHTQELEKKIAERTVSLHQIIAELQTFSYTIAHDLRAPIRAVNGYCQVLLDDYAQVLPPDAALILQRLRSASTQMDALTRDLLEFSKVSRQDLTLTAVDLEAIVTETVLLAGLRVSSATHIEHPLHTVYANRTLVGQCVSNLLQNAVKFCQPGTPPAVRIRSELVSAQAGAIAAPRVRLWIEDNGIGISPEAQRKVFGIFERGDRASEYEGTGIGLAIVARAMERMGGSCGVESALNQGSRFWLEFPAAERQ
jgi:signal transduction histidine kinase